MTTPNIKHIILTALSEEPETMKDLFDKVSDQTGQDRKQFDAYMYYLKKEDQIEYEAPSQLYSLTKKGYDYLKNDKGRVYSGKPFKDTARKSEQPAKKPTPEREKINMTEIYVENDEEEEVADDTESSDEVCDKHCSPEPAITTFTWLKPEPVDNTLLELVAMDEISRILDAQQAEGALRRVLTWVNDRYEINVSH